MEEEARLSPEDVSLITRYLQAYGSDRRENDARPGSRQSAD
jgi:hypothetical protein